MKFKLDENLGKQILKLFRENKLDACTVAEQDLCSSSDTELYDVCRTEGYCIVTMNKDFASILNFPPRHSRGIVVIRQRRGDGAESVFDAVRLFIRALKQSSPEGKLWIVDGNKIREYSEDAPA